MQKNIALYYILYFLFLIYKPFFILREYNTFVHFIMLFAIIFTLIAEEIGEITACRIKIVEFHGCRG